MEEKAIIGTPFKAGNPGKPKGAVNHLTKTVKETVLSVFNELQKDPKHSLKAFGKRYPRDFYAIAARLIPTEIRGHLEIEVKKKPSWFDNETTHILLPKQEVAEADSN